jgi:Cu/Ag efflux protein CusF
MRFVIASCAVGMALALAGCDQPRPQTDTQKQDATRVRSRGVVVAVTPEYNAVTIQHEPIPGYQMPAMTMEFTVADGAQLDGIAAGDTVTFELSGPIDIATITEAPN